MGSRGSFNFASRRADVGRDRAQLHGLDRSRVPLRSSHVVRSSRCHARVRLFGILLVDRRRGPRAARLSVRACQRGSSSTPSQTVYAGTYILGARMCPAGSAAPEQWMA